MSFQISKIILYNSNGKQRVVEFKLNAVNIITGASKTGKSAILHIVNYCLGSESSTIPEGEVVKNVAWYGVLLSRSDEQLFIARKNPGPGKISSEEIYFEKGKSIVLPDVGSIKSITNLDGLIIELGMFSGISEYSFEPKPGQTRKTGIANIGKALIYCFQEQGEVADQYLLFHKQGKPYLPQSIKDYMPFFLGAVERDYVQRKEELRRLKQELKKLESAEADSQRIIGSSFERPHTLVNEAVSVGLIPQVLDAPQSWAAIKNILRSATDSQIELGFPESNTNNELSKLFEQQKICKQRYREIDDEVNALLALKVGGNGFAEEAQEHRARLSSLGLIKGCEEDGIDICPLCASIMPDAVPGAQLIRLNLQNISRQLDGVSSDLPHIEKLLATSEAKRSEIASELREILARINSLQQADRQITAIRDNNAKRSYIKGRVALYLETIEHVEDKTKDNKQILLLTEKIQLLEKQLNADDLHERLNSILSYLSKDITELARTVDHEYSCYPIRIDIKKLTVVADTENGWVPLERMGSGDNWVTLHLIVYLVLQKWFVKKALPVPHFVFFDQPTQAYFPPDVTDENVKNTDRDAVVNMFRMVSNVANDAGFQVIVIDHADIQQDWFQSLVVHKWWDGKTKLVPIDWIK